MIFIDSNVIVAYKNQDDEFHSQAVDLVRRLEDAEFGGGLISDYNFSEILTVLLLRAGLKQATEVGDILLNSKNIEIARSDDLIFNKTYGIFRDQEKTKLSFVDCSNLAVMELYGIRKIATFDKEFKKIR